MSWNEVAFEVKKTAASLKSIGINSGQNVGIIAPNSYLWTIFDIAIMAAGAVSVPIYPYLANSTVETIIKDANLSLIVGDNESLSRIKQKNIKMISFNKPPSADIIWYRDLPNEANFEIVTTAPTDATTIVYTSGTTGEPRGAVITSANIVGEIDAVKSVFNFNEDEIGLLCLPMAHVLGRLLETYQLYVGCQLAFCRSIDTLAEDYIDIRPHFTCVVPRMLEKIHERVFAWRDAHSWIVNKLFDLSLNNAKDLRYSTRHCIKGNLIKKIMYIISDRILFKMLRSRLGGRIKAIICGGASLRKDVADFFFDVGLPVYEGYGLTETFAAIAVNRPHDYRTGTVGKPLSNIEIRIGEDKEILVRGPMVFAGYRANDKIARNCFDEQGWFYTGDIGEFTKDGFLRLNGRKKDLIVTSAGKNVVPNLVESVLMKSSYIDQAFIYGDNRKYIVAIIVMDMKRVISYLHEKGVYPSPSEDLTKLPETDLLFHRIVQEVNSVLGRHETIKKYLLLSEPFTVKGGELTYTMKLRREIIAKHFEKELDELYLV